MPRVRGVEEGGSVMGDLPSVLGMGSVLRGAACKVLFACRCVVGLIVDSESAIAQTRNGKQILNVPGDARAVACCVADGDMVAVVGVNRKLIVFPLSEVPEMTRGKGVFLQRFKDGGLADVTVFDSATGFGWQPGGGRARTETDLTT